MVIMAKPEEYALFVDCIGIEETYQKEMTEENMEKLNDFTDEYCNFLCDAFCFGSGLRCIAGLVSAFILNAKRQNRKINHNHCADMIALMSKIIMEHAIKNGYLK